MAHINRRHIMAAPLIVAVDVPLAQRATAAEQPPADMPDFMAISKTLTWRDDLDPFIAQRLYAALKTSAPENVADLAGLDAALKAGKATPAQEKQALAIQSAWYTGQVDKTVVTYEEALAFKAVADVLSRRSYCGGEPGFWAKNPNIN